jgi:multidrug transporter EmrE-like cation transporter
MRSADLALILTGVLLNAAAQLLLKAGARAISDVAFSFANGWTLVERIALNPPILGGLACYVVSVVFWILALSRVDVSVAYPMLSIGYVVNALAAWLLFSEQLNAARVAGIGTSSSSASGWSHAAEAAASSNGAVVTKEFLPFTRPSIDEATIAGVAEVLRSGWITSGPQVREFEARLSDYFGGRPVRALSSAPAGWRLPGAGWRRPGR